MKQQFLNWLDKIGRKRIIYDRVNNLPYLERYYLFLKDREHFPFNIFLHKFLNGDPDDLHDHPWPYATFILKGGYYEWVPKFNKAGQQIGEQRLWRGPGHFRVCAAKSFHRIELKPDVVCWTLFMPGPHAREWGFLVGNSWVQHDLYLKERYEKTNS